MMDKPAKRPKARLCRYQPVASPPTNGLDEHELARLRQLLGRTILYPLRTGGVEEDFVRYGRVRRTLVHKLRRSGPGPLTPGAARAVLALYATVRRQRDALFVKHHALALGMQKRLPIYEGPQRESAETRSVAGLALLRAIERFDPAMGFRFSTYAMRILFSHLHRARAEAGEHYTRRGHSLDDRLVAGDVRRRPTCQPGPAENVLAAERREQLDAALRHLHTRTARMVLRYYGGETMQAIADDYGLSRAGVQLIVLRGVNLLRAQFADAPRERIVRLRYKLGRRRAVAVRVAQ